MYKTIRLLLLLIFTISLYSGTVQKEYQLGKLQLNSIKGNNYIDAGNGFCLGDVGAPSIPYRSSSLLLADGEVATEVEVTNIIFGETIKGVELAPIEKVLPLSKLGNSSGELYKDQKVYGSDEFYPKSFTHGLHTGFLSGNGIATFTYPIAQYNPVTKELKPIISISFELKTESSGELNLFKRSDHKTIDRLRKVVDNPEDIPTAKDSKNSNKYDLLLITSEEFAPHFESYLQYKNISGYRTAIETVESIYQNYSGSDNQERIRNCVIDYYQTNEIDYLILGGDSDPESSSQNIIPHRGMFGDIGDPNYIDEDIPSDIYYSNLDGNWDSDGDSRFGEDGEEDFYGEVSIGRICVDSGEEITNITHKLQSYQDSPVIDSVDRYLMVGEQLTESSYAKPFLMEVSEGSDANGYSTSGFSSLIERETLYRADQFWFKDDIYDMFNNSGINMLHHLGHSSTTYNMVLGTYDLTTTNFTNDGIDKGYVLGYTQGCYAGAFDNRTEELGNYVSDCFGEVITTIETAEAAFIGNSRFGWGVESGTNAPSQFFHREYVDAIFGEGIHSMGDANRDSKEDNIGFATSHGAIKWCLYQLNLLGDPTLNIFTKQPMIYTDYVPSSLLASITNLSFYCPLDHARSTISQNGEIIAYGSINSDYELEYYFLSDPMPGDATITLTAPNHLRFEKEVPVVSTSHFLIMDQFTLDDANGNGVADYGEEIKLDIVVKNCGSLQYAASTAILECGDGNSSTIIDGSVVIPTLESGESISIDDAFTFVMPIDIMDQQELEFSFQEQSYNTGTNFEIVGHAPIITVEYEQSSIFVGTGYGVDIYYHITNSGSSDINYMKSLLSITPNQYVSYVSDEIEINDISPGETKSFEYHLDFDQNTPSPMVYDLAAQIRGGNGFIHTYNNQLRVNDPNYIFEDFSTFPPEGWSIEGGENWIGSETNDAGGEVPEAHFTWNPSSVGDQYLISPIINFEEDYTNLWLSFKYLIDDFSGGYNLSFLISEDGGDSWEVIKEFEATTTSASMEYFDFDPVYNPFPEGDIRYAFKFSGDSYQIHKWAIDDFSLSTEMPTEIDELIPEVTSLYQNYPNPFNPSTSIRFDLKMSSDIKLEIYNSKGQMVDQLINSHYKAGNHSIIFDGKLLSSGVYYYKLIAGDKQITKKMIMLK